MLFVTTDIIALILFVLFRFVLGWLIFRQRITDVDGGMVFCEREDKLILPSRRYPEQEKVFPLMDGQFIRLQVDGDGGDIL